MKHFMYSIFFLISLNAVGMDKLCNGAATVIHSNGGGRIALTAVVASTVLVEPDAAICEYAMAFGTAEVKENSRLYGAARIGDNVTLAGNSAVFGNAVAISESVTQPITVSGSAKIYGNARLLDSANIQDATSVFENGRVEGDASVEGTALIYGNAVVGDYAVIRGTAKIHGRAVISGQVIAVDGANICDGKYHQVGTTLNTTMCTTSLPPRIATEQIVTGASHVCSLHTTGKVKCWGSNIYGQLGYGNTTAIGSQANSLPNTVGYVKVGGKVVQLSLGVNFTCALLDSGKVRCWGANESGQLGYGHTNSIGDNEFPQVAGDINLGGVAVKLSSGGGAHYTCALLDDGNVVCWGSNYYGQLGYSNGGNNVGDNEHPSTAGYISLGEAAVDIAVGEAHTCAVLISGNVKCWGRNDNGVLGLGNTNFAANPPSSLANVNLGALAKEVKIYSNNTCVLTNLDNLRCWGNAQNLGYGYGLGVIGDNEHPATVGDLPVPGPVVNYGLGTSHVCVLLTAGNVKCWGTGNMGSLGHGAATNLVNPMLVGDISVGDLVTQISSSANYNCVKTANSSVRCWGTGPLGYGSVGPIGDNELPSSVGEVQN